LGCNCGGKKKMIGMTSAQVAEEMARKDLERRMDIETAKAASGEHSRPLPRVVRR
jgi:hypothetical protein